MLANPIFVGTMIAASLLVVFAWKRRSPAKATLAERRIHAMAVVVTLTLVVGLAAGARFLESGQLRKEGDPQPIPIPPKKDRTKKDAAKKDAE